MSNMGMLEAVTDLMEKLIQVQFAFYVSLGALTSFLEQNDTHFLDTTYFSRNKVKIISRCWQEVLFYAPISSPL